MMDRRVSRFIGFLLVLVIATLIVLTYQVSTRNESITEIRQAAARIEMAAVHTEEVLLEVVEARGTPEAVAQNERVRDALSEISDIKALLCDTVTHEVCENDDGT